LSVTHNNSYIDKICKLSNELKITIGQEDLLFAPAVTVTATAAGTSENLYRNFSTLSVEQGL
jgi:hypothetical protein